MLDTNPVTVDQLIERNSLGPFQKWVVVICMIIIIFDGFDILAISFTAPAITSEWGMPKSELGFVFSAVLVGMTLGALILGPLGDRYGRRPAILVSTLTFAVFSGLTALATSFDQLLVLRFLTGLGLGGAMPNTTALMTELVPEKYRNLTVGIMFIGIPVGGIFGGFISAWLIPNFGWPAVFVVGCVLPLMLVPVLLYVLPESPRFLANKVERKDELSRLLLKIEPNFNDQIALDDSSTVEKTQVREIFHDDRLSTTLMLWLAFFTNLMAIYFLFTWVPTLLVDQGHSLTNATRATVILNVGGALSPLILAWLVVRYGSRRILAPWFALGSASLMFVGYMSESLTLIFVGTFSCGIFVIGGQVGLNALASYIYPTNIRSTGHGWALGIGRIGSIAGPILAGYLIELGLGLSGYFMVFSSVVIITSIAILLIKHQQQPVS